MSGSDKQQTQKTDPWAEQIPYLKRGFAEAQKQFLDTDPSQRSFSPESEQAAQYISGMLGPNNEAFNKEFEAAKNAIIPQVQSNFAGAGRLHSGLAQTAEAGAVGDAFAKTYQQDQERRMRAAGLLGQFGQRREEMADYNANAKRKALQDYINAIQGNYGGTSTQTIPGATWDDYLKAAIQGAGQGAAMAI